ncbi:MAG: hypothetical protein WBF53_07140 [Litorimonas sp.]
MNILTTALLAGTISALPAGLLPPLSNPVDGLSVCAAGLEVDFGSDGVQTQAANSTDFRLELRFKSHAPIRVRL